MNYSIKNYLVFLFFSFVGSACFAQVGDSTHVLIQGIYQYDVKPYKMTMEFSLEENGVSCGPNSQFESIDDQYAYLMDSLQNYKTITQRIVEEDNLRNLSNRNPKRTYSFESTDINEFKILKKHAEYAFASGFEYFYHYKRPKLEDQDEHATKALEDAENQVKILVKNTDATSYKIVAIDDFTSSVLGLRSDYFTSKYKLNESNFLTKSYALNVHYAISK